VALAVLAAFALGGCGTGVHSQTSNMVAAVPGYNTTGDTRVGVRNALLTYSGAQGYKAGSEAPVELRLFNNTNQSVEVQISAADGSIKPDALITVAPQGLVNPSVKLALRQDLATGQSASLTVEFVGIKEFTFPVNIAPPNAPAA